MQKHSRSMLCVSLFLFSLFLAACGSSQTTSSTQQPVTLKLFWWNKADAGPVVDTINKKFHAENPNITIQYESVPTDQFETVLKARLAGGDAPDVFGVKNEKLYAKAGSLLDVSDQSWVSQMSDAAKGTVTYNNKIYGLAFAQNVLAVMYNKKLFADHNLTIPKTWDEFLQVSQKLKDAGLTPIALGSKDLWVDDLIPYAMAPNLYQTSPTFDSDLLTNKASFVRSTWKQMLQDYLKLNKQGYFNKGALGTTYDQTVQLMAPGKTGMVINGNWMVAPIQQANPSIDLGMFPIPYSSTGQPVWVSSFVGEPLAISSQTKHAVEAKKYLQFWSRPDILKEFLESQKFFSTMKNVSTNPGPVLNDMSPYLTVGSHNAPFVGFAPGVQDALQKDIQSLFTGDMSVDAALQDMDKVYQQNKSQIVP